MPVEVERGLALVPPVVSLLFAGYAADDLVGWKERKDGETKIFKGVLDGFDVSKAEAEQMILAARLKAGWITEDDLVADEEPAVEPASA